MWRHEDWEKHKHSNEFSEWKVMEKSDAYEAGADAILKDVNDALAPLDMSFGDNGLYVPTRNPEGGN